ncbi:hypothetical protein ACFYS8_13440 [Kitasatospora sp. NPDC004615]|uniref:hypothetical protein n=1 Tax=Kitasatospora sp. NPDC004615 TaxID=3364017 RepID=UPI003679EC03
MSAPLVVFGDAQAAAATYLRAALAGRAEPYAAGATVGTRVPDGRRPEDPHLPYVLARLDGAIPDPSRANSRVTLRLTVWHIDPDQAHDLAQLVQGLMAIHNGPVIRSVRPALGPVPALDPDSAVDLSTCTVTANVRPIQLT